MPRRRVFAFGWNAFAQLGVRVGGGGGGGGGSAAAASGGGRSRLGALGPPPGGLPPGPDGALSDGGGGGAGGAVSGAPGGGGGGGVAAGFSAVPVEGGLPVEAAAIGAGHYTSYAVGVDGTLGGVVGATLGDVAVLCLVVFSSMERMADDGFVAACRRAPMLASVR